MWCCPRRCGAVIVGPVVEASGELGELLCSML